MIAPLMAAAAVSMSGSAFTPGDVTVLTGETVSWTNHDNRTHTATAIDGSFDSGGVAGGASFSRRFDQPGVVAYRCRLHRFMRGSVQVVAIELSPPSAPVAAGEPAQLTGRAPQPGTAVELERVGAGAVATAVAGADGRFGFRVETAGGPARYRARAGGLSSAVAEVAVAPQVRLAARRGKHGVSVRVHAVPAQPGATVVLERHERERFGYVRLGRRGLRLDAHSRARTYLRLHRRLRLRARLVRPVGGYARATSEVVVVPRAGSSRDGGHH